MSKNEFCLFLLGVTGTILGLFSSLQAILYNKVRIKVIPKGYQLNGSMAYSWDLAKFTRLSCIEVVNLSNIPVTIAEVGFMEKDKSSDNALLLAT